jgi:hypothetical protein
VLNIFTDFHHAGLLNSLIMLFEGRFGGEVYRPIGKEWFEKGYWKIYDHPATVEQFLAVGGATPDGTPRLNESAGLGILRPTLDGVREAFICHDIDSGQTNKAITFQEFMRAKFDIVIASLPQHIEPFKKLCEEHPNHPKLIYQIGNAWDVPAGQTVKNVMASAMVGGGQDVNIVYYHQEFNLDTFCPDFTLNPANNIYSFVNCFSTQDNFAKDWNVFEEMEMAMQGWSFKSFGGQCRDGHCNGTKELAQKMREAKFIWHTKAGGDGYGHVLFNTAAVGRPIITRRKDYWSKMGEKLMIEGETCIDVDGLTIEELRNKIEYYSEPQRYKTMCKKVFANFTQKVDFDKEADKIKVFIDNLI